MREPAPGPCPLGSRPGTASGGRAGLGPCAPGLQPRPGPLPTAQRVGTLTLLRKLMGASRSFLPPRQPTPHTSLHPSGAPSPLDGRLVWPPPWSGRSPVGGSQAALWPPTANRLWAPPAWTCPRWDTAG